MIPNLDGEELDIEFDHDIQHNIQHHDDEEMDDDVVDHNDVKIIDAEDNYEDDDDLEQRPLNRHEENLADLVIDSNDQFDNMENGDDEGLDMLHDQLQILDDEGQENYRKN